MKLLKNYIYFIYLCACIQNADSVVPSGEILIQDSHDVIFSAPAYWAGKLPEEYNTIFRRIFTPQNGSQGCYPVIDDSKAVDEGFYLLVERGECSFEHKAKAAFSVGAIGVVIYNSEKGVYQDRDFALPEDYECKNGEGWVTDAISSPVWENEMKSKIPISCSSAPSCASHRCLFTNTTNGNGTKVCCAWDMYINMGPDKPDASIGLDKLLNKHEVPIPAVFVRMQEGDYLLRFLNDPGSAYLGVAMFARPLPPVDIAAFLIWIMAVTTVICASVWVAKKESTGNDDERKFGDGFLTDDGDSTYSEIEGGGGAGSSAAAADEEESIDITAQSAFAFIAFASCALLLFFFVDLHILILVIYVVGATLSIALVFIYPLLQAEFKNAHTTEEGRKSHDNSDCIFILSLLLSGMVAGIWYYCRYESWSWVLQDFMGASVCLCFLHFVRLPNLQVATILLTLAFFYDVFFVFITPYLFGTSVMVHVAEGGVKPQHDDPNFCEKYPEDADCRDTSAPNLLVVPSIGDYRGGSCMLGLGDIILPGLFLVLVARIDVRQRGFLIDDDLFVGLFGLAIVGYGAGLFAANQAVTFFQFGQPALLYIVPLILIPVLWRAADQGTLEKLWENLPLPGTVAVPLRGDEQRRLLDGNNDILSASASWGESTGELNIKVSKGRKRSKKKGLAASASVGGNS